MRPASCDKHTHTHELQSFQTLAWNHRDLLHLTQESDLGRREAWGKRERHCEQNECMSGSSMAALTDEGVAHHGFRNDTSSVHRSQSKVTTVTH